MSMETTIPFHPVNNDRMAAFSAFRIAIPSHAHEHFGAGLDVNTSAATVLPAAPAPRTTHLDDAQADDILTSIQQENKELLLQAHNGIDAQRVARLLSLLD